MDNSFKIIGRDRDNKSGTPIGLLCGVAPLILIIYYNIWTFTPVGAAGGTVSGVPELPI